MRENIECCVTSCKTRFTGKILDAEKQGWSIYGASNDAGFRNIKDQWRTFLGWCPGCVKAFDVKKEK